MGGWCEDHPDDDKCVGCYKESPGAPPCNLRGTACMNTDGLGCEALVAEDIVRAPKQVIAFIVGQVLRAHRCATCVELSAWLMMACPVSCVGSHLQVRSCD